MGNFVSAFGYNSYMLTDGCSARNITWQYIHTHGNVSQAYTNCQHYDVILRSHCCINGVCKPSVMDVEFGRYAWVNTTMNGTFISIPWDGMGYPTNETKVKRQFACWPLAVERKSEKLAWKTRMQRAEAEKHDTTSVPHNSSTTVMWTNSTATACPKYSVVLPDHTAPQTHLVNNSSTSLGCNGTAPTIVPTITTIIVPWSTPTNNANRTSTDDRTYIYTPQPTNWKDKDDTGPILQSTLMYIGERALLLLGLLIPW
ncbi:hypothetical protein BJ878DRAFT_537808 [Calycina marina]|uniref:Uncharacterized protein n=1 Tax=Calycina marina TaxID=1763456 RepID=A0A9P8CJI8_9HELO|nr:hypothetical protein BJ878DRAFT_537808 [Calycina marina]